jgi:hypothetical protein
MSKTDESAFPQLSIYGGMITPGLTKREYAAIHIAAALVSNQELLGPDENRAKRAVTITDVLIAALERKPE